MKVASPEFVRVWRNASSIADVVAATGLTHSTARTRASRLRSAGISLRDLRSGTPIGEVAYPDAKVRRDAARDAGECINQNKAKTHPKPRDGKSKCDPCIEMHRRSA